MTDQPLQDALRRALALLRLGGFRGAFVGGLAVIVWGRPRATQDLDLLLDIEPLAADRLLQAAAGAGYDFVSEDGESAAALLNGGFIRLMPRGEDAEPVPLDILVADTPLHQEALTRVREFELFGERVPVLSAEDLILLKLVAFRPKDTFDLETVIDAVHPDLDLIYLRRWADRLELRARLEAFIAPES